MASRKTARRKTKHGSESSRDGKKRLRTPAVAAIVVVLIVAVWWALTRGQSEEGSSDSSAGAAAALSSAESAESLVGRWQRVDAGYIIEVRGVDRNGRVDAAYYNPDPIHVSKAHASDAAGGLDLFVELMDVGYPGATYVLRYNPEYDVLVGLYHQPTAGQDFEVAFRRK